MKTSFTICNTLIEQAAEFRSRDIASDVQSEIAVLKVKRLFIGAEILTLLLEESLEVMYIARHNIHILFPDWLKNNFLLN